MVTCLDRADLLALVGDVYCSFVTFPCDILGQVWYLIVSFLDLCRLSYIYFEANISTLIMLFWSYSTDLYNQTKHSC